MAHGIRSAALRLIAATTLTGCAWGAPVTEPVEPETPPYELPARFAANAAANVRSEANSRSTRRGVLLVDAVIAADTWAEGRGCNEGWLGLQGGGWVCSRLLTPTVAPLTEPPTPTSWGEQPPLPFIYARRRGANPGRVYSDAAAAVRGGPPLRRLIPGRAYHFTEVIDEGVELLVLPTGGVVRRDDVSLYDPSPFVGEAIEVGATEHAAWARGTPAIRSEPSREASSILTLTDRQVLWVGSDERTEGRTTWLPVLGPSAGWIRVRDIRRVRMIEPLEAAAEHPWLDLDLKQQVLTLRDRSGPTYATLVSSGTGGDRHTPLGIFSIQDKMLHWDMANSPASEDRYHVEEVPWVMHFWPRFALHGAFWHDGFGGTRSHGCVNLSPRDARALFDATSPTLPVGWHSVWQTADDPGTLLRIHAGSPDVPDRRDLLL